MCFLVQHPEKQQRYGHLTLNTRNVRKCYYLLFNQVAVSVLFLIGFHSMQGWTATTRHGNTRKKSINILKHTGSSKLLFLDLKPLRTYLKGKHSIGGECQGIAVRGKKLLT